MSRSNNNIKILNKDYQQISLNTMYPLWLFLEFSLQKSIYSYYLF